MLPIIIFRPPISSPDWNKIIPGKTRLVLITGEQLDDSAWVYAQNVLQRTPDSLQARRIGFIYAPYTTDNGVKRLQIDPIYRGEKTIIGHQDSIIYIDTQVIRVLRTNPTTEGARVILRERFMPGHDPLTREELERLSEANKAPITAK